MAGGTNHHLSTLPHKLVHAYVNLFNFLLDLVEAIRTELALNVACKASSKKCTNRQAAGWLDPHDWIHQNAFTEARACSTVSETENSSSENASWDGCAGSSYLFWALMLHLQTSPQCLYLCVWLSIWCPATQSIAFIFKSSHSCHFLIRVSWTYLT